MRKNNMEKIDTILFKILFAFKCCCLLLEASSFLEEILIMEILVSMSKIKRQY